MAFSAVAGLRFNVFAGGFGLRAERRKVSSSKAGVTSGRLRPEATWFDQPARCVDVLAEAPAFGKLKKVTGHHGFNWSICAASPPPEENEPTGEPGDEEPGDDEPGDKEPTSDEDFWNIDHEVFPDLTSNGAARLSDEDLNKRKLEIYGEYVSEDLYGDDKWLAQEMSRIYTEEYYKEPVEQAEAMEVVGKLDDLYSKSPNPEDQVPLDEVDYVFQAHLLMIFVIAGLAAFVGIYSKPVSEQLNALLPMIKKAFGIFFYSTLKYGRYNK